MATTVHLKTGALVLISDVLKPISKNLDRQVTVTNFVLEADGGEVLMEFEVRVKKIGTVPVPRNTKPGAALG